MKEAVRFVMVQFSLPCPIWVRIWSTLGSIWSYSNRVAAFDALMCSLRRRFTRLNIDHVSYNCPFSKPIYAENGDAYESYLRALCIIKVRQVITIK